MSTQNQLPNFNELSVEEISDYIVSLYSKRNMDYCYGTFVCVNNKCCPTTIIAMENNLSSPDNVNDSMDWIFNTIPNIEQLWKGFDYYFYSLDSDYDNNPYLLATKETKWWQVGNLTAKKLHGKTKENN